MMILLRRLFAAVFLLGSVLPAAAEYLIAPNDVLELTVYGVPELNRRARVGPDGTVHFPPAGRVSVGGLSLSDARARIQDLLVQKSVIRKPQAVADEVIVEIVDFRPFFVTGDVAKPGEYPYSPGLTVRQAIALAGGVDTVPFRTASSPLLGPELRGELEILWSELVRQQVKLKRLKAQLDGKDTFEFSRPVEGVPNETLKRIVDSEREQLRIALVSLESERAHLNRMLEHINGQLTVLQKQEETDKESVQQQTAELARVRGLSAQGVATTARVAEEQRSMLLAMTRAMQTSAQTLQMQKEREGLMRQLQKLDEERRANLASEIEATSLQAEQTGSKQRSVEERLLYAERGRTQLAASLEVEVEMTIHRRSPEGKESPIHAEAAMEVLPSDVVEVRLWMNERSSASSQN
jgi:polysaccharide export outer membrane protein